jgi:hypothetical protein
LIPFAEYLPDQPDYAGGTTVATNVFPRTAGSYGPVADLSSSITALSNRPQGAASFRDSAGNVNTFAGDLQDLFLLSGTAFNNVSSSAAAYTTAVDDAWKFGQYGERIIAVNGHTDQPQSYLMGTDSAFSNLAAAAPRARHIGIINNFVMLGNTWDSSDGAVVNRVWWSAIDSPGDWPTIGSADAAAKQSDRQDLPIGGPVQAITGAIGGLDGAIWTEKAIYRVQYAGPPTVFDILEVERDRGTSAPNSVVNVGTFGFYLGEDDFYRFDGAGSTGIGHQRVSKTFFSEIDQNYYHRVYGAADPLNKLVWWAYPGTGNTGGRPNKQLIYNWALDRWGTAEIEMELLFRQLSSGYTLDELDQFGNLDTLPFSLDSRIWTLGRLLLAAFDENNVLSAFSGSNLQATIETAEVGGNELFGKPHERMFVDGIRPYIDGGTTTVGLKYRDLPTASLTTDGPNAVNASTGMANFSRSTRYARAQVIVAAGGTWSHAQGVDYDVNEDGEI